MSWEGLLLVCYSLLDIFEENEDITSDMPCSLMLLSSSFNAQSRLSALPA